VLLARYILSHELCHSWPNLLGSNRCIVVLSLLQQQQIRTDSFRLTYDSHLKNRSLYKAQLIVHVHNYDITFQPLRMYNAYMHNNNTLSAQSRMITITLQQGEQGDQNCQYC